MWTKKHFGDCAELIRNSIQPDYAKGMNYIGLEHISQGGLTLLDIGKSDDVISQKSLFNKGDILFGKLRPYFRKVVIAPFNGVCSTDIWVVRAKPGIDQRFLFYWMASKDFVDNSSQASEGTKMPRAIWEFVSRFEQEIPPLPEQRAIADVLGALDDKIELNRKMNATLESLAQTLFKHTFLANPERDNWNEGSLSDICEIAIGGDWGTENSSGNDLQAICLRGVDLEHLRNEGFSPNAPIRWIKENSLQKRKMTDCDVLIAGSGVGPVGRPLWISPSLLKLYGKEIIYSNFCKRLTAKSPSYALFIDRILHNLHQSKEILDYVNGTSLPNLDINGLIYQYPILIPPQEFVDNYFKIIEPFMSLLFNRESQTLAELRDTLLPKLMTGQVRVT